MRLKFIHNFRILEIVQATEVELEQIKTICTAGGYNWQTKEKWEKCLVQQNRYLPGGFWKDLMMLTKEKKPWSVQIENLKDLMYDIEEEEFMQWLDEVPLKSYLTPRWYQSRGAYLALKYRISRGQFATSAGKSLIQYIVSRYLLDKMIAPGKKVLMIVPSIMLVKQMAKDVAEYADDDFVTVDQIYGGSKRNKSANLVVGNIDSLVNRDADFFEQFEAVLVDEAHKLSTKSYQQVLSWIPNGSLKLIYAVSGTFHAPKTYDALLQTMYAGPILMNVDAKMLMDELSVTPLKIKCINMRYDYEVSKAYYHYDNIDVLERRNLAETNFIKSLNARTVKIANTVKQIQGNQLLLFKSVEYCDEFAERLKALCPDKEIFVIHGRIPSHIRTEYCNRTEEIDNAVICATYPTLSTGISIKRLTYLHLLQSVKTFITLRQSIGRVLRLHPDKQFAMVIDYIDIFKKHEENWPGPMMNIAHRHGKARQKTYKEQDFDFDVINSTV